MNPLRGKNISFALIITFTLVSHALLSQQEKFDSLKSILKSITTPKARTMLLLDIANSIYSSVPDSSIMYCKEAEELSSKSKMDVQYAYSLNCESRYLLLKGDLKNTIVKLNEAISIFERNNENKGIAKSYSLKSIALSRLNKHKEAIDYLLRSKKIYNANNDTEGLIGVLTNLSNTYCKINQYQNALDALKDLEKLNLPDNGSRFFIEISYGTIYFNLNQYDQAIVHFDKAAQVAQQYKMIDSEISGLTKIAECYERLNQIPVAKSYYYQALNLARFNNLIVEEADALKGLVTIFEHENDYQNAFNSLKQYKNIEDSIFTLEKFKNINDVENKLKLTEKEKIIAEQNFALEKEKGELASTKSKGLLLVGGLILAIGAFMLSVYYSRRTKKLYSLIQIQKSEVESQKEIIEIKNKDLMDSINYARHIQSSMLPSPKTMSESFKENFILYKPKDVIAGDFYWTENIYNKPILAVCDCTGHGVPGAMVSIVAGNALNRAIKEFKLYNPALIFDKVNELMQETFSKSDYQVSDGMDGAICVFDYDNMKLHIAAANNPVWTCSPASIKTEFWEDSWLLSQVSPDKQPIGKFKEEVIPFQLKTIAIERGEMIYLFTDGFADQFGGPKGKKFKYKQLQELLTSIAKLPCDEQQKILTKTIDDWKGTLDQVDDMLIVGIRI